MHLHKRILIYPNLNQTCWPWWVEYAHGIRPCQSLASAHAFALELQSTKYGSSSVWLRHGNGMSDVTVPVPDEASLALALLSRGAS